MHLLPLNRCLDYINEWMSTSKLKLSPDKTEFIIFGSKRQRDKLKACFPVDILDSLLCPVESFKNLSVWFNSDFSLSKNVQNVCKICFVPLHDFRQARPFLTHFNADDGQVYMHLSQKNASTAFVQLNRCLDDVNEWMSTSKFKLNLNKTEFIIFGSKRQWDKLKACFPKGNIGVSSLPY